MWPILLLFLGGVFIAGERCVVLRNARLEVGEFLVKLKSVYRHGGSPAVLGYCAEKDAPIANIIRRGILKHGKGVDHLRAATEKAAREEIFYLERRIGIVVSIAIIAPVLGLFGTLTGIIGTLQSAQLHATTLGPGDLAAALWQALLPFTFGVAVAMPLLALRYYYAAGVRTLVHDMDLTTTEFLDLLEEGSGPPGKGNGDSQPISPLYALDEDEFFRRKV